MRFLLLLGIALLSVRVCVAAEIVAIVNDEPISSYDVQSKAKLIAIQNSREVSDQIKQEYFDAALNDLIDDKVKIAQAQKDGFSVTDDDIKQAISHLEEQNHLKQGQLKQTLSQKGVPLRLLQDQVKADLLWIQVIQKNKNALIAPTQEEINKQKAKLREDLKKEGFYVAEILIPDSKNAETCYKQLHEGKSFQELAQKYSQAESASAGGEVGWIESDHYPSQIMSALRQMSSGELSAPLKTQRGYLIILLLDKKVPITTDTIPVWEVAQMGLPANKTAIYGKKITKLNGCEQFMQFAHKNAAPQTAKSGMISPEQLPKELRIALEKTKTNRVIGPISAPDLDLFFMKCSVMTKEVVPSNDNIRMMLEAERMEKLSERLLKNAKRFAVIEKK